MRLQPQALTHILAALAVTLVFYLAWQSWNNFWTVTEWTQDE